MSVGLKSFAIRLNRSEHTFAPGESLGGRVFVELNRPKTVKYLKVRIKGEAEVKFTESNNNMADVESSTNFTADELYFRQELYILGQAEGDENLEIPVGYHVFPFEFILPYNIPSNLKTIHGGVKYSIKAIMERPWKFDHKTSVNFDFKYPCDLTMFPNVQTMIYSETHETLSFLKKSELAFTVRLQSNGVAVGEDIVAQIDISNETAVNVTKIKLRLVQSIHHNASFPFPKTKTITEKVQRVKENRTYGKKDSVVLRMSVPESLPYSYMLNCNIISIQYDVLVKIILSGFNCKVERRYPIVIGSRPVAQHVANTPEIQQL